MERFSDGKRGFSVADAISLSEAWLQVKHAAASGMLQITAGEPPHRMLKFFATTYPPDQMANALRIQLQTEAAERVVIRAIRSGALPLWIAPTEGPITERLVSGSELSEFGRESLNAGCYRPFNDTDNLAYGYPLFVKECDWATVLSALGIAPDADRSRSKGGRPPEIDWAAMKKLAEAALSKHPDISCSKLADSLVAEYAEKVNPKPPAKRTVERKLKQWDLGATKPV